MFTDLLDQELGGSKPASGEARYNCPFCGETDHKMYVEKDRGLWICFKCSEKGNPVSFVMKYYSVSFPEAIDILEGYGYDVDQGGGGGYTPKQYGNELSPEEQLLLFISREGQPYDENNQSRFTFPKPPTNTKTLMANFENPEAFPFFAYLHRRGVSLEQIKTHNISYVTEGEVTLTDGRKMNIYNHLVFYTFDGNNKPMYWNTRSIDPDPFIKSFNGASGEGEYSKNNSIFNLNNAKKTDKIVITEGVFDAMTVGESGVGTFGKKVTDMQLELLIQATEAYKVPIYMFLDADATRETTETIDKLQKRVTTPVYIVMNDTGKDANDLGTEACATLIDNAVLADTNGKLLFTMFNLM